MDRRHAGAGLRLIKIFPSRYKESPMFRLPSIAFLIGLMTGAGPATAQAQAPAPAARPARPMPPARDPHTPGYVTAKELPDGENAPANADGNFIIGPTHNRAPEMTAQEG